MVEISPAYAAYIVEEGSRMSGRFTDAVGSLSHLPHISRTLSIGRNRYIHCRSKTIAPVSAVQDILSHPIFAPFTLTWENIDEDRKNYDSQAVLPE